MARCQWLYGCDERATKRVRTWRREQLLCAIHAIGIREGAIRMGAPEPEIEDLEPFPIVAASPSTPTPESRAVLVPVRTNEQPT